MSPDRIHLSLQRLFDELEAGQNGLSQDEAERRLKKYGRNEPAKKKKRSILKQFLSKFLNPLVVALIAGQPGPRIEPLHCHAQAATGFGQKFGAPRKQAGVIGMV